MIPSVVLDPSFFWLFSASDTEEEAETTWNVCKRWLKDSRHGVSLLVHSKSIERLREQGMIPSFGGIQEMVGRLNLEHVISPHELSSVIDRFLSNVVTLEEVAPVRDGLFADQVFEPDEIAIITDINLREHSHDSVLLSALNCSVGHTVHYAFPRLSAGAIAITAGATIDLVDAEEGTCIPDSFEQPIKALRDPDQFYNSLNPQEIWDSAADDSEVKFAIRLAAERLVHEPLPSFEIGQKFVFSLRRNQAIGGQPLSATTLTKCAQALAGGQGIDINEFKYEAIGNKAAKVRARPRDNATAYRVHVTTSGVGLRLMLWKLPSGAWELANVGPKNEEKIEIG